MYGMIADKKNTSGTETAGPGAWRPPAQFWTPPSRAAGRGGRSRLRVIRAWMGVHTERDQQKCTRFCLRSRSKLLNLRMILSPNRLHFGGSCARDVDVIAPLRRAALGPSDRAP